MTETDLSFLHDTEFKRYLQKVRETNNTTNWFYIGQTWLFLALVLTLAVLGYEWAFSSTANPWVWAALITLAAIPLVGAGQHHLGVLGHEGSHRTLFRHRLLNELASDWFCMFPLFSTTYMYRLQHLAHHQFVNDPDRDPNVVQMRATDTWPDGPLTARGLVGYVLKLFWLPHLFRFTRSRIKDNAMGGTHDVYRPNEPIPPRWPKTIGAAFVFFELGLHLYFVYRGETTLLAIVPVALWLAVMVFYVAMPHRLYHKSRVKPDVSLRTTTLIRLTGYFALFHGLAWLSVATSRPVLWYWLALWMLPLLTAFPLFLVLRQLLQHANGGRGRLDNTRVFLRPKTVNFFLLPLGQDYHLPHHLFASIPHYRLRELHEWMCQYPDYRAMALEVEGVSGTASPGRKTILGALGSDHRVETERFIDSSVLDTFDVTEREAIKVEEQQSATPHA